MKPEITQAPLNPDESAAALAIATRLSEQALPKGMPQEESPAEMSDVALSSIEKAIKLHQEHLTDPSTETPQTQQQLMQLLENAKEALSESPVEEVEKTESDEQE